MSDSFDSADSKTKKRRIFIPFWIIYIIIPVLVLAPILYFILLSSPEDIETRGLSMEEVEKIENDMKILETSLFQSLSPVLPGEFVIPKEKVGRKNPFAPIK